MQMMSSILFPKARFGLGLRKRMDRVRVRGEGWDKQRKRNHIFSILEFHRGLTHQLDHHIYPLNNQMISFS